MEHAEALERIEIAAAEPEGLDRLMAGDTADAAAIAGHLAGCPACTAELARVRRTAAIAREVIRTAPDPSLRARTLAYVQAAGVPRGGAAIAATPGLAPAVGARARPGRASAAARERRVTTPPPVRRSRAWPPRSSSPSRAAWCCTATPRARRRRWPPQQSDEIAVLEATTARPSA